jgi:LuxR family transcriptional regulator, maltose regulon positive regulatory protein
MSGRARPVPQGIENRAALSTSVRPERLRAFELIRSKLDVPGQRPGLVERTALVDRLGRARSGRFVSVVAPPGYGKTTALAQWAERDKRASAWVSLDRHDNDPVVLMSYIAEALNGDGRIDASVFRALTGDSLWAAGLPRLGAALASRSEPIVLVLDDVHELVDPTCLDVLTAFVLHVPRGSQLVLSGRSEARLGLAKLRADGELLELGPTSFALNDAEAHQLLTAAGLDVTEADASALNDHAEGWAAGLYLAALSLDGADDHSPLAAFAGDDRFVTDYLRSEHLSRLLPDQIEFLTRSSVLDRMSGPLCDSVLERHDSARMLEALEHENLFVIPLDHRRMWFRYHHLFREMLRAELERREPELALGLNRRAAAWCEANDQPESAVEYAAASGDVPELARLATTFAFPFYRTGRVSTVERWLSTFDDPKLLEQYPAVAVFGAWLHALRGRPESAERWALALEACESGDPMPDGSPPDAWAATVRALLCRRGVEQMRKDAELALAELSAASPWRPIAMLLRGSALLLSGETDGADAVFAETAEAAAIRGATYAGVVAHSEQALLALDRGDLACAQSQVALGSAFVDDAPSADYVVNAILLAASARLAVAQGQGARARETLVSAQRVRPMLTYALSWFSVQARLELAKAHLALSDARGAATLYHEADEILRRRPRLGTLVAEAEEIRSRLTSVAEQSSGWASTLTAAELRLLPLLTTHLSFREIAERLFVSRNTVKTQAISVYRKLDASSRSEAIERAIELGLVNGSPAANGN